MTFTPPRFVTGLTCFICGAEYPHGNIFTCPVCGIGGILDVCYDYDAIGKRVTSNNLTLRGLNHWRYKELLPISSDSVLPHLHIGWTPVYEIPRLAQAIGVGKIFVKDEGRNPTSSFKDRASSVGVLKAAEFGFEIGRAHV